MQLPYPTVTQQNPFLYFTVQNISLAQYANSTGPTQITVYRVRKRGGAQVNYPGGAPYAPIYYTPLEVSKQQRFTFVMDSQLFVQPGGRYMAVLQYNGAQIGCMEFIYDNPNVALVPDQPNGI